MFTRPQTPRLLRGLVAVGLLSLGAGLLSPLPAAVAASEDREVVVWFREGTGALTNGARVDNAGSAGIEGVLRTRNGGRAVGVEGPWGGEAFRLPDFAAGATPSTVPIAITTFGGPGQNAWRLNPGTSDFRFGASFKLAGTTGSSWLDNGDNLVQRGLWNAPSQYKIELDRRQPACRVKGAEGAVMVTGSFVVPRGEWFNIQCERDARGVTLSVGGRLPDGSYVHREWRSNGRTGSMWGLSGDVPLSVGGKVDDRGAPVLGASDQFNGSVDNVVVDIDR